MKTFKNHKLLEVFMLMCLCLASANLLAQERKLETEDDGFRWYELKQGDYRGAQSTSGTTLIPLSRCYTFICYHDSDGGWFGVKKGEDYGVCDKSGREIVAPGRYDKAYYRNEDGYEFVYVKKNGKEGACDRNGREIVAPIYESLIFTSIDYVFEYKDAAGDWVSTGITVPKSGSSSYTSNNSSSYGSSSSSSGSYSSTSQATSSNNEPGLLYRGEYTISEDVGSTIEIISIYEDRIVVGGSFSFDYKSTNSKGNRVYSGNGPFGVYWRFYVSPNYNIRLTKDYPNPFGGTSTAVNCRVTKGQSSMPVQNGGEYYGGSEDYNGTSGGNKSGTSGNPVQPHQITESCPICHGSGKCNTCNGTHRYLNGLTGKYLECPNCKPDGRCTHCGGSGKVTKTKYY